MDQPNRLSLVLKVETEGFLEVLDGVIRRFTLTHYLDLKAASDEQVAFLRDGRYGLHTRGI